MNKLLRIKIMATILMLFVWAILEIVAFVTSYSLFGTIPYSFVFISVCGITICLLEIFGKRKSIQRRPKRLS